MDRDNSHFEFWLPVIGIGAAIISILGMFGTGIYLAVIGQENLAIGVLSGTGIDTAGGIFLQRKAELSAAARRRIKAFDIVIAMHLFGCLHGDCRWRNAAPGNGERPLKSRSRSISTC